MGILPLSWEGEPGLVENGFSGGWNAASGGAHIFPHLAIASPLCIVSAYRVGKRGRDEVWYVELRV